MDKKTIGRITATLGDGPNSYYVYMLCDSKTHLPFYIGKGKGGRAWQHEETITEIEKIIKDLKNRQKNAQTKYERASLKKEISLLEEEVVSSSSEKFRRIELLKSKKRFEKVIVKWGLTEHEAFMVESALMNMYFYMNSISSEENSSLPDDNKILTNAINGHMSKLEKDNISHETKARTVKQFLDDCAIEQYSICNIKDNVQFVSIGNTWADCKNSESLKKDDEKQKFAIMECSRAAWPMSEKVYKKADQINYVFALYKSQVVGTYKLINKPIRRCELSDDYIENRFPKYPEKSREVEKLYTQHCAKLEDINAAESLCRSSDNLSEEVLHEVIGIKDGKDKNKAFVNWKNRVFFELEEVTLPDFKEKKLLLIPTTGNPDDLENARKFNVGDTMNFIVSEKGLLPKDPSIYIAKK